MDSSTEWKYNAIAEVLIDKQVIMQVRISNYCWLLSARHYTRASSKYFQWQSSSTYHLRYRMTDIKQAINQSQLVANQCKYCNSIYLDLNFTNYIAMHCEQSVTCSTVLGSVYYVFLQRNHQGSMYLRWHAPAVGVYDQFKRCLYLKNLPKITESAQSRENDVLLNSHRLRQSTVSFKVYFILLSILLMM